MPFTVFFESIKKTVNRWAVVLFDILRSRMDELQAWVKPVPCIWPTYMPPL